MVTIPYLPRLLDAYLDELLEQLPALMVVGPRAAGKSTTLSRRAATLIELDVEAQAAAFEADPDAALRGFEEPVMLDEWQHVPGVLGAVRRAVQKDPRPNRFYVTGSVQAELENQVWPGTGRLTRVHMYPMTVRELDGQVDQPSLIDRLSGGDGPAAPTDPPDLRGYIDLGLRGGFPMAALLLTGTPRDEWFESYLADLLTHDVEQLDESKTKKRDPRRLRSYFEAYALNSAGLADHATIYNAAKISKNTAATYEELLADLFVTEQLPAWSTNRLKRLVAQPRRYVIDPALMAAVLRLDAPGIIRDGDILGRFIDTLVVAQIRPEVALSKPRARLFHIRTQGGRQEIDLVGELGGDRVVGIEVKAGAAPKNEEARHLVWLRDKLEDRFVGGVVFHTGPRVYEIDDRIWAAPIASLWS